MDILQEEFFSEIKKTYPAIQKNEIQIYDDGWDYLVCAIENKEVFRFPRRDDYATTLPREVEFLKVFSLQSPIQVPDMTLYHLSNNRPYVRYPFIKGDPFDIKLVQEFSNTQLSNIAKQLGKFLTSLHSFPIDEAKILGFEEGNLSKMWQENFEKAQKMVFPYLHEEEQDWIKKLFENYFKLMQETNITNKLTHGDIMPRHMLIDTKVGSLSGIIDFGDMVISDPSFDFAFLGKYQGKLFLNEVYKNYMLEKDDTFDKRRQFYESRSFIAELEHAIALEEKEDIEHFNGLLREYIRSHLITE